MPILKLTCTSIQSSCVPPEADEKTASGRPVLQRLYMDNEVKGFGVLVTRTAGERPPSRTFFVQREVNGRTVRVKIGRYGDLSVDAARKRAQIYIAEMLEGKNPNAEKKSKRARGVTLTEAALAYRKKPAKRTRTKKADLTLDRHDYYVEVLKDWAHRPLCEIRRSDVLSCHRKLSEQRGEVAANNAMRWFRSVYNAATLVHEGLPQNPCVVLSDYWNREKRKRSPIAWPDLPKWVAKVNGPLRARNPVRADLNLFLLFSGLRRTDACTIRVDEISLELRKIFRPKPKGGEDKAFDMPLSDTLFQIVEHRIRNNRTIYGENNPWLFPSFDRQGLLTHTKEPKEKGLPSPHRLRDTFVTASHEAGVNVFDQKILTNHAIADDGDVTNGYKRPSWEHVVKQQELVVAHLLQRTGGPHQLISDIG